MPLGAARRLWAFWRGGKLTKQAIHKALSTAYELYLFDARWFLDTIQAKGGAIKGTDVLADGLTKEELTGWVRRIHETGDGTPKGIVAALGWDKIVAKTPNDVLVAVLDAMVAKVGLVLATPRESGPRLEQSGKHEAQPEPAAAIVSTADETSPERVLETLEKPDDGAWSMPPQHEGGNEDSSEPTGPLPPPPSEEAINIVLEEDTRALGAADPDSPSWRRRAPPSPRSRNRLCAIASPSVPAASRARSRRSRGAELALAWLRAEREHAIDRRPRPLDELGRHLDARREIAEREVDLLERVLRMNGHSLQAQFASGGAGMNVLLGACLLHLVQDPGSVATMNSFAGLAIAYFRSAVVEPMKSAIARTGSSHSGCAMTSASGCRSFSATSFRSLKVSWTMQLPCQRTHLAPDLLLEVAAEVLVGREEDRLVGRDAAHDLLRVRRGDDVVGERLHLGGAVDVADDDRCSGPGECLASTRRIGPPGSRSRASSRRRGPGRRRCDPGSGSSPSRP